MQKTILLAIIILLPAAFIGCGGTSAGGDSPTETYKELYAAVKAKDTEVIKSLMSKKTHDLAMMASQRNKTSLDKVYENGFTATTFADSLPEIRDERVNGDMGAVEVWNAKDRRWEDLGFVREDGRWKLAFGDQFAGTFKSPGKGRAQKEAEAANAMGNNMIQMDPPANMNARPMIPKPATPEANKP
jgi:hypothetical protein